MNSLIQHARLVTATEEKQVQVMIEQGVITAIHPDDAPIVCNADCEVIDAAGLILLPGLIDTHVHFREPGLTHKADMATESRAALAGGVTTVCEMPNTIPPTVTIAALADKVRRAAEIQDCDIRFYMGITEEIHVVTLRELWAGGSAELDRLKARCCGAKLYLDHSTGNQKASSAVVEAAFQAAAEFGIPLVCHCENPEMNTQAAEKYRNDETIQPVISRHSFMRPPESEVKAIEFAISLAKKYSTSVHIAHLSTAQGIDLVRKAKQEKISVTCEVAPHHLFLSTNDYQKLGIFAKMNPPVRSPEHKVALWNGIADGTVDSIATDHAPHTLEEKKNKNPLDAPSGVPGVETMLPLLLTVIAGKHPHPGHADAVPVLTFQQLHHLCFDRPNAIFSLGKSGIQQGAVADMILVDPAQEWTIQGAALHSKCGWTSYEGWKVQGAVVKVWSRGKLI